VIWAGEQFRFVGISRSHLIIKDSYWRWPERDRAGNTIDFFVQVLGLNFHQAMRQIISL
jgi:hypothetical protein